MHYYYKIYKPYGYLSQFVNNQKKRKSKKLLGELFHFAQSTMAVGRLDEKSEGLLLLTTDGYFSNLITSSKYEKEYHVLVDGIITSKAIEELQKGVGITIKGQQFTTNPCSARALHDTSHIVNRFVREDRHGPTSWLSITLREGKYRQVRKMTAKVGFPTLRLVRIRIGKYQLNDMKPGDVKIFNY